MTTTSPVGGRASSDQPEQRRDERPAGRRRQRDQPVPGDQQQDRRHRVAAAGPGRPGAVGVPGEDGHPGVNREGREPPGHRPSAGQVKMTGGRAVGRVPVLFVVRSGRLELLPRYLSVVGPCQATRFPRLLRLRSPRHQPRRPGGVLPAADRPSGRSSGRITAASSRPGGAAADSSSWLARLNGRVPKNPLCADIGLGCADSMSGAPPSSGARFLRVAAPQDGDQRLVRARRGRGSPAR